MGKRELLIIAAFVVTGVVAWQLTAPPPAEGTRGFSLDTLAEFWRNRNGDRGGHRQSVTTSGVVPANDGLSEIRLASMYAVEVTGSDRDDITWTMVAEGMGPTEDAARASAERVTLDTDAMGSVLALSVRAPADAPQTSTVTLAVPARMAVRVESARRTAISSVAWVRLENLVGDVQLRGIRGGVDGGHRNGVLAIEDARDVTLTLVGSTATITRASGAINVTARNGSTRIDGPLGRVDVEVTGQELAITSPQGPVRASSVGGALTIERAAGPVDIDTRRTRVRLSFDRAVPATVFSAEDDVTITLPDLSTVDLDIAATNGSIDASAAGLNVDDREGRSTIVRQLDNAPRIAIRSDRGRIVIAPPK
jgi:DUF4097 and DUF4098 domain-containing protein YvlB